MTKFVTGRKKVKTDGYELNGCISRMSQLPPVDKVNLICLNQLLYILGLRQCIPSSKITITC